MKISVKAVLSICCFIVLALTSIPAQSETLPDFKLQTPFTAGDAKYLGVPNLGEFNISDIDSEYLLIEIFSMYCPYCQAEAENVNDLFDMIKAGLPDKLKLIGIGAGNTPFEVEYFRDKYAIEFPLFSDPDYVIHKRIGQVGTPYFYLLKRQAGGEMQIIMTQEGPFASTDSFYKQIKAKVGK
jgi:peroxiredoxin